MTEEQTKSEQKFSIQRIYLKDVSLETPMGTEAFLVNEQPQINQDLNLESKKLDETLFEVVLKLTISAKLEDKTVFLIEVHQGGLFTIKGFEGQNLVQVLNTVCPQVLFPYAREAVDSALLKATFPPVMLPPVNFDAVYAQALAEQQEKSH